MAEPILPIQAGVELVRTALSSIVNRFLLATIVLLIGFIAGRLAGKFVEHIIQAMELNKAFQAATSISVSIDEIIGRIVSYGVYFIVIIAALDVLGVNSLVFTLIPLGIIAVLIISVVLAIRDMIPSLVAGWVIHSQKLVRPGDKIKVDTAEGKVVKIGMLETRLLTTKGDDLFVPNATMIKHELVRKRKS